MRGRGWIIDVIQHFILICLFAVGLYFIWQRVDNTPALAALVWLRWLLYFSTVVLAVLFILFVNSLFANYHLERFNPTESGSLQRLAKIRRFMLPAAERDRLKAWQEPLLQIDHLLQKGGYSEAGRWRHGIIYIKGKHPVAGSRGKHTDQCFVCYKPILNVLIVDGVIRDCMLTISKAKAKRQASHNYLLFISDSQDKDELTSSAAGVVNFLGKIEEGSLGPMLLDLQYGRLFFPLDRSLIPWHHRRRQNALRQFLRRQIREERPLARGERFQPVAPSGDADGGVRRAKLSIETDGHIDGHDEAQP